VLSGEDPEPAELWAALRKGTLAGAFFCCFGGSALRNQGVQPLLDAVVHLLPAPLDRPPSVAARGDGETEEVAMDPKGPLAALAFKVQLWEGRRHVFTRIYRGRLRPGDTVELQTADGRILKEHAARVFDVDAGRKSKLDEASAGQVVLLAGLRHASTGDTLCQPGHLLSLERIEARRPVLSLAIEPSAAAEEDKLVEALGKIQEEDPTLRVEEDAETGQRLLRGMGELHLQIVRERLEREFGLRVRAGRPAVAVRETIRAAAAAEALYAPPPVPDQRVPERMARAAVKLAPRSRGSGNRIQLQPRVLPEGAALTPDQGKALETGAQMALEAGPLQGAAVEDVEVRLTEVELFGQASTPEALAAAAARAVSKALQSGSPAALHPVMSVEVVVPEENLGTVLGDLQARRALIRDTLREAGSVTIACEVPLERLLGYTTELRSQTQGRGQFSMLFDRFDLV
jgi:elongation factor G